MKKLKDKVETVIAYMLVLAIPATVIGGMLYMYLMWLMDFAGFHVAMKMLAG